MADEDRIAALSKRLHTGTSERLTRIAGKEPKPRSERARHTLYLETRLVEEVDTAYKQAAHALFPQEVSKSEYLEACLRYALSHEDEIRSMLSSSHA